MKPCWHRSSPFPSQSSRQESNLPVTAYQTVASPLGFGPKFSALDGTRTRLACSTGRSPHPLRPRAEECPAGVEPAFPARQAGVVPLDHEPITDSQGSGGRTHALRLPTPADYRFPTP